MENYDLSTSNELKDSVLSVDDTHEENMQSELEIVWTGQRIRRLLLWVLLSLLVVALIPGMIALAWTPSCTSCHTDIQESILDNGHRDVACKSCHRPPTVLGRLGFNERVMYGMVLHAIPVHRQSLAVRRAQCESCHDIAASSMQGIQEHNGLRINHERCATGIECTTCHGSIGHLRDGQWVQQYSMDQCLRCHTRNVLNTEDCTACHAGRTRRTPVPNNGQSSVFAVVHGPNWRRAHGLGDQSTCSVCHGSADCARCHGPLVPHDRATILAAHGPVAKQSSEGCATCHDQTSFCDACHVVEMPHPSTFLKEHSTITGTVGNQVCANCHHVVDCDSCHAAHVHPGGARL